MTDTVEKHVNKLKMGLRISDSLGCAGPYVQTCSLPPFDHCGYEVAIHMLMNSLNPGRINKNYTQWDTIRKLRTCYSNFVRSSNQANITTLAINDNKGVYQRIGQDACGSFWFSRFLKGCQNRMGCESRRNKAFSTDLLLSVLHKSERRYRVETSEKNKHLWLVFWCYSTISYVISLRGSEGFLLDLEGLIRHQSPHSQNYFIIALRGKIKGEVNDRNHLIPCANKTKSGINVKSIVNELVREKQKLGFHTGPAISDIKGKVLNSTKLNIYLLDILEECFKDNASLFPSDIRSALSESDEVREILGSHYACYRTFRRTSDTRAMNKKRELDTDDVDIVNRWRTVELSKGRRPQRAMRHHYADVQLLLDPFLRYTSAM